MQQLARHSCLICSIWQTLRAYLHWYQGRMRDRATVFGEEESS